MKKKPSESPRKAEDKTLEQYTIPREVGMPILRATGCLVGRHNFSWTGTVWEGAAPSPGMRCHCGMYSYGELWS